MFVVESTAHAPTITDSTHPPPRAVRQFATIDLGIVISALLFIFALIVSAYFEPRIRALHTLQALIYLFVIIFSLRHSKWGYGVGISIAAFWNYANLFVTTFIVGGVSKVFLFLSGGPAPNANALIAVFAALSHFGLIIFCMSGYLRLPNKKWHDTGILVISASLSIGYFATIVALTAQQYLFVFEKVFHL